MKPKTNISPAAHAGRALTAALLGRAVRRTSNGTSRWPSPKTDQPHSPAGSTRVTVYSTGRWKAEMAEGAWGEVSEVSGNGIGDFSYVRSQQRRVAPRASSSAARAKSRRSSHAGRRGHEPTLALAETEFEFVRLPRERVQIGVTTNMTQALECILITATDVTDAENPAEAGWLKEIRLERRRGEHRAGLRNRPQRQQQRPQGGDPARNPRCRRQILAQAEASVVQTTDNATVVFKDEETTVSVPGDQHNRSALLTANFTSIRRTSPSTSRTTRRHAVDHGRDLQRIGRIVHRCREHGRPARSASLKITYKDTDVECSSTLRLTQEVSTLDRRPARHDPRSGRRSGADGREDSRP
ncbi:MAG: hypothetical protein ACLRMJ_03690 [Alistipes finegoldii]